MQTIRLKKGLTLGIQGKPEQRVHDGPAIKRVRWQVPANDLLQPDEIVSIGQSVRCGDALFIDRYAPDVLHVAPVSGIVRKIIRSAQQSLLAIEIECSELGSKVFAPTSRLSGRLSGRPSGRPSGGPFAHGAVRSLLQQSGLWTQIRERPFETTPAPDSIPEAIFVTALDSRPLAPDPAVIIAQDTDAFTCGLDALATLTAGTVYLCQAPGITLPTGISDQVRTVAFDGPHPVGLPGLHMHKLHPVDRSHRVWHLDAQDVMAVGGLLRDGILSTERVIALAGDQLIHPRLIRTRPYANVDELLKGQLRRDSTTQRANVGNLLTGHQSDWLGRFDRQVSVAGHTPVSANRPGQQHFVGFIAEPRIERVNAYDLLPVPLMRALLSGEVETAEVLGALELAAEDLDLLSYLCPSGNDYGAALSVCHRQLRGAPA